VLLRCYYSVTVVSLWSNCSITVVLLCYYCGVTMILLWCNCGVTVLLPEGHGVPRAPGQGLRQVMPRPCHSIARAY
jgi:hypothetical protein